MPDVTLVPPASPFQATLAPPGSKSLTNRALVLASMAEGESVLSNVLFADDTEVMLAALSALGHWVDVDRERRVVKVSGGAIPAVNADVYCGNSGTTLRFLAAAVARGEGQYTFRGNERMHQRPVGGLGGMLKDLGIRVKYLEKDGYPPLTVLADGVPGGVLSFGNAASSQYLSAVLMVAPFARHEVQVNLVGEVGSWPYVAMTMRLMDHFGHWPELERDPDTAEPKTIVVPRGGEGGGYVATAYPVEPDASNASYLLAAAALHAGSRVTVHGLGTTSLQGDVAIVDYLGEMGAKVEKGRSVLTVEGTGSLRGVNLDLRNTPDLAQTLAVLAVFAKGETTLRGLRSLRVKETDRVAALEIELTKLGAEVEVRETEEGDVTLSISPPRVARSADIATYDDHRMAMSFALAGSRIAGVTIREAQCCSKTYPGFFEDFSRLLASGNVES